ncbi:MAG: hypothetical protein IT323_05075 [Anaerolineae bacterium]|nr:hypothetical protein [Anaerolineae bacterium]
MIDHDLTPEQRAELGDLETLYSRLSTYDAPEPDSARLLAALTPLLAERRVTAPVMSDAASRPWLPVAALDWLRLAWTQTALLEAPFWLSSALLTLIGLFVAFSYASAITVLSLILLSPLLAVAGVAYIFRPATRTLWELEQLSRIRPFELLYARLALILALNIALALVLLLAASTQGFQVALWRLLLVWFGPMIGLTGLALFCTVRWSTVTGVLMSMLAWCVLNVLGWREAIVSAPFEYLTPQALLGIIEASNMLLVVAATAFTVGVALLLAAGRWVAQWR